MRYSINITYWKRVISLFKPLIVINFIVCISYGVINGGITLIFCFCLSLVGFLVLLIRFIQISKFFLNSIEFDEENGSVKYSLMKCDKVYLEIELNINDLEIKIIEKIGVYRTFQLELKHNDTILRQRTIGGWTEKRFVDILTTFNKLKDQPTYISYVEM